MNLNVHSQFLKMMAADCFRTFSNNVAFIIVKNVNIFRLLFLRVGAKYPLQWNFFEV